MKQKVPVCSWMLPGAEPHWKGLSEVPELGIKSHPGNVSCVRQCNPTLPSPSSSLIFYYISAKVLAFVQMYNVSKMTIMFQRKQVHLTLSFHLCSFICPNHGWFELNTNSMTLRFPLRMPALPSTPRSEWYVYSIIDTPLSLYTLMLPYLMFSLLSLTLLQPSRVAWAMISNFCHYISCLHNALASFSLTVLWREHERGIPPCHDKTKSLCCARSEKIMSHFKWSKPWMLYNWWWAHHQCRFIPPPSRKLNGVENVGSLGHEGSGLAPQLIQRPRMTMPQRGGPDSLLPSFGLRLEYSFQRRWGCNQRSLSSQTCGNLYTVPWQCIKNIVFEGIHMYSIDVLGPGTGLRGGS